MNEKIVIDWHKFRVKIRTAIYAGAIGSGPPHRFVTSSGRSSVKYNDLLTKIILEEIATTDIKYGISIDKALGLV